MNEIDLTKFVKETPPPYKREVSEKSKNFFQELLSKNISVAGAFNDKSKEKFFSEMSILFSSGVDIKSALEIIEGQAEKIKTRKIINEIKNKVTAGDNLSNALQSSGFFSSYEFYSLKIGEETGKLPEVLFELSRFFQNKIRLRRQVISTLSYPIIVVAIALGAVLFMMSFVVPMFADVFKRFNTELPAITVLVLKLSAFISKYFWIVLLLLLSLSVALYMQRRKPWFRDITSRIVLATPFLGNLIRKIYTARFCLSMKLLIASRTTLTQSVDLVSKMVNFYPMEIALQKIENELMHGKHLYEAVSQFEIFPPRLIALVKVGEEVNKLDNIFGILGAQYSEEIDQDTKLLGNLIEPIIIIFLGLFVAVILVSMYMPLFKLGTSIY